MKKVVVPFALTIVALIALAMIPNNTEAASSKTTFKASITCDGCKNKIEKSMKDVDGINSVNVDVETKTVNLDFDPEVVTVASLKTKVADLGYDVTEVDTKKCSTSDKECSTSEHKDGKDCDTSENKATTKDCGSKDNCCKTKTTK